MECASANARSPAYTGTATRLQRDTHSVGSVSDERAQCTVIHSSFSLAVHVKSGPTAYPSVMHACTSALRMMNVNCNMNILSCECIVCLSLSLSMTVQLPFPCTAPECIPLLSFTRFRLCSVSRSSHPSPAAAAAAVASSAGVQSEQWYVECFAVVFCVCPLLQLLHLLGMAKVIETTRYPRSFTFLQASLDED